MESKFVQTPEINLHYLEWAGNGPPAILLHGTGLCAQVWAPVAQALSSSFRVLALDLRGHGDSEKPQGQYGWEQVAGDLPAFMDALELDNVLLVGHSRGGGVAAIGGAQRPERVSGMVLIEPTLPVGSRSSGGPTDSHRANPLAEQARRRRAVWDSREQIFHTYRRRGNFKSWREDILWAYVEGGTLGREDGRVELKCPPEVEARYYEFRPFQGLVELLSHITCPVLLMTQTNQSRFSATSPAVEVLAKSASSFQHIIVPDTGHFIPQEQPQVVEDAIWEFVRGRG